MRRQEQVRIDHLCKHYAHTMQCNQQLQERDTAPVSVVKKRNWSLEDLPSGTDIKKWKYMFVPRFMDYFGVHGEPWENNGYVAVVQDLWDSIFVDVEHQLTRHDDPVYPLVCCLLF